jgi:hypothetical protein
MTGNTQAERWRKLLSAGVRVERKPISAQTLQSWFESVLNETSDDNRPVPLRRSDL